MPVELLDFTVGPFCGHTTTDTVRIWGAVNTEHINVQCRGIVRWRKETELDFPAENQQYFNILGEDKDGTGIADVPNLDQGTLYIFQAHYFLGEADEHVTWHEDSHEICMARTVPASLDAKGTSFILGSCRDHGSLEGDGLSDLTFRMIHQAIHNEEYPTPDLMLLGGDQIYVDMGHGFLHSKIYRAQFAETHFDLVRRCIPTYMQMDDHEVQNDWSRSNVKDDHHTEGLKYFEAYQAASGPVFPTVADYETEAFTPLYWYKFDRHDSRYFVMDVRNERFSNNPDASKYEYEWHLRNDEDDVTEAQIAALVSWIEDAPADKFSFILTPVPLFPDAKPYFWPPFATGSIKELWTSNTRQRNEILDAINASSGKFIFLSGDVHCSFTAQLTLECGKKVYSIVSSAMNWMLPGLNKHWFDKEKLRHRSTADGNLEVLNDGHIETRNNYTLVTVRGSDEVEVVVYDGHHGGQVKEKIQLSGF
ncbi:MAG: alkaline phosphatase D family protein [Alphaproteobacteria bacterium]|nr:alkaline phosphatase D family protein [Alphaproteobacteria bacterium]